jgi:uncharacterized circularly permuted ATP-grasp superfamily protein/uncharacterized alpha-E superfamily protein
LTTNPTSPVASPFDAYQARGGGYDEFRAPDGRVRAAWSKLAMHLESIGPQGLRARATDVDEMLRENGATFLSQSADGVQSRPWQLSCVPFVMDAATWTRLELGLTQRVRLLEAILDDLLGAKRLIREGALPPELLTANPSYARVFGNLPTGQTYRLHLTATDLARGGDGQWCVTGHRSRAPSGLGYALENRIVTSRAMQRVVHQCNVQRLASFFSTFQEHLISLATRMRDNPRIAILTPGKSSYRYFEDVYLARYLGYTLVQGRDLAVRKNRLHLKTLSGLLPIEVLWRHVSDDKCDPLELHPAATQGVSGLLETVRKGNLAVVNSIGAMLVEMPALLPFLAAAQRMLFGGDLELANVEIYWCGDELIRKHVLEKLDEFLIRDAFTISGKTPIDPNLLSAAARAELIAQIKHAPHQYVGQRRPQRSTTPVWHQHGLQSWHVALRCFHLQTEEAVKVLPGGLVRVSERPALLDGNPTNGQLGQDCWVIGDQAVDPQETLLPPVGEPVRLVRGGDDLPSRVAEHLFWLGRYVERTEAIARLLRTTMIVLSGEHESQELPQLARLVAALAAVGQVEPDYAIAELRICLADLEQELPRTMFAAESTRGIRAGVGRIVDNAFAVRDRLSIDAYRILTQMEGKLSGRSSARTPSLGTAILRLDQLITDLLAFAGFANESLTRSHAWRFMQLGMRIERAHQTAELLATTLVDEVDGERPLLEEVLKTTDCIMTYRSRYLAKVQVAAALDLIVTDNTNPRSIVYQLQKIADLIRELPGGEDPSLSPDERIAERMLHQVRMADPGQLAAVRANGKRESLDQLTAGLVADLPELSDAITARYLIHTRTQELTGRIDSP